MASMMRWLSQGLMLLSATDLPRPLLLPVMGKLQGLVLTCPRTGALMLSRHCAWSQKTLDLCVLHSSPSYHAVLLQGLMLLSPAIDVPRTLLLRIMEMLQGLVLPFFPHWRIVPSPPLHVVTEDLKLVRALYPPS